MLKTAISVIIIIIIIITHAGYSHSFCMNSIKNIEDEI